MVVALTLIYLVDEDAQFEKLWYYSIISIKNGTTILLFILQFKSVKKLMRVVKVKNTFTYV